MTQTRRAHKTRVALVFGGRSGEHEVSCATAASVMNAIDQTKFEILPIGITKDGRWVHVTGDVEAFSMDHRPEGAVEADDETVSLWLGSRSIFKQSPGILGKLQDVDVIFPLLHGPYGEDGTIQGLFEMCAVPYVGCGVAASAVAMNKHLAKTVLRAAGINVGRWTLITDELWHTDRSRALAQVSAVGTDLYIKPARAGSSLGITHVTETGELEDAIAHAREYDRRVVAEAAIAGREIECGVLETEEGPRASVCGEIAVKDSEFYDYNTKYVAADQAELSCPAAVPEQVQTRIQQIAVEAFTALGCEGLARVDFFYDEQTDTITLNEVNTMPGFTPISMYPQMWQATGIAYPDLITTLIEQALTRPVGLR
ncbi:D-alanine--D-alanine ligase family protein [Gleimia hominis]|uniref:D-alanine--D-alanine ligase n=1 Tax=Gleimia hominis TaxID=595468 RepID=A0ABU3IC42_9ACTO|nr:D-alanine--D-alanine ligase family protein [Gleimia hominis]MDT3767944.1 D-alanine--D-alanine ligase family protein [Gleimia hominis]